MKSTINEFILGDDDFEVIFCFPNGSHQVYNSQYGEIEINQEEGFAKYNMHNEIYFVNLKNVDYIKTYTFVPNPYDV